MCFGQKKVKTQGLNKKANINSLSEPGIKPRTSLIAV